MPDDREPWHLDRRIPIATLAVLIGQIVLGIVWITTLDNRVSTQGAAIGKIEAEADQHEAEARILVQQHEARLRAIEVAQASQSSDLRSIQIGINRIETKLEKMSP
jgi:hypothetical protein